MKKRPNIQKLPPKYRQFYLRLSDTIAADRLICDPLRTLAYGTDASFYRLNPKIVVLANNESEVVQVLKCADHLEIAVTFRAAGTSLSGQAVTDSVLVLAGDNWKRYQILNSGRRIRMQPGIIGGRANAYLAPLGRKIGPDPASINAAMIGGIAANNASGMCCGTAENSYKTLAGIRIVLSDGTVLDTGSELSCQQFNVSHAPFIEQINKLADQVKHNATLAERIRHKFKIKNTTGYSLNALIDFEDPFDIIAHLMIGSEGTLAFISEIDYHTVLEHPHKASALMVFPGIREACEATIILKRQPVAAVELMDRAALRSVENKAGMPGFLKTLPPDAAALLVETRAAKADTLHQQIDAITTAVDPIAKTRPVSFTDKVAEYTQLWNIRKGLFPAVGAVRETGTTVIIEDVAFPIDQLAKATLELQQIMAHYQYHEAIIFGHALEGNLHFVFTQDFGSAEEIERYRQFMDAVCEMVVARYDGSLKAEHGTGRNMAPFVEMEWGREAYQLMQQIKAIFDPKQLLNPGVILNPNPQVHIENLKPLPATNTLVDKCIECGFCETVCPSKNLTLTPRQRITVQREISRLEKDMGQTGRRQSLIGDYAYQGDLTCATDGLCEMACPVEINTGALTKELRHLAVTNTPLEKRADWAARHFSTVTRFTRQGLKATGALHNIAGAEAMAHLAHSARKVSGNRLPLWNPFMPTAAKSPKARVTASDDKQVVYLSSCIARTMGPAKGDPQQDPLPVVTQRILTKCGYDIRQPQDLDQLCCGMPFASKGFKKQADAKAAELQAALLDVTNGGRLPVLCDTSPCVQHMRDTLSNKLTIYEPVEFVHDFVLGQMKIHKVPETVAVHVTCSSKKMGLDNKFMAVAVACANEVVVPDRVECCGFAGDRGFTVPELNAAALADLKTAVSDTCHGGYSNSRTCEIGLSLHSGIYYRSILYLVDRCID